MVAQKLLEGHALVTKTLLILNVVDMDWYRLLVGLPSLPTQFVRHQSQGLHHMLQIKIIKKTFILYY